MSDKPLPRPDRLLSDLTRFLEEQMPLFTGASSEFDGAAEPEALLRRIRAARAKGGAPGPSSAGRSSLTEIQAFAKEVRAEISRNNERSPTAVRAFFGGRLTRLIALLGEELRRRGEEEAPDTYENLALGAGVGDGTKRAFRMGGAGAALLPEEQRLHDAQQRYLSAPLGEKPALLQALLEEMDRHAAWARQLCIPRDP